jgi:hypothetical protein
MFNLSLKPNNSPPYKTTFERLSFCNDENLKDLKDYLNLYKCLKFKNPTKMLGVLIYLFN